MAFSRNRNLNPDQIGRVVHGIMHAGDPDLVARGFTIDATGPRAGNPSQGAYSVGHLEHELKIAHPDLDVQAAIAYVSSAVPTAAQMAVSGRDMGVGGWGEPDDIDDYLDVTELIPRTTGDPHSDPGYRQAVNKAVAERQLGVGELDATGNYAGTIDVGKRSDDGTTYSVLTGPGSAYDNLGPDPLLDVSGGLTLPMERGKRLRTTGPGPAEGESFT